MLRITLIEFNLIIVTRFSFYPRVDFIKLRVFYINFIVEKLAIVCFVLSLRETKMQNFNLIADNLLYYILIKNKN